MKDKKNFAGHVGTFFAYVQAIVDEVVEFGFEKLKDVADKEEKTKKSEGNTVGDKMKKGAKGLAKFVGEVGATYYEEYEQIKAEKKNSEKKK